MFFSAEITNNASTTINKNSSVYSFFSYSVSAIEWKIHWICKAQRWRCSIPIITYGIF